MTETKEKRSGGAGGRGGAVRSHIMFTHTNIHSCELYRYSGDTPYVVAMSGMEDGIFFMFISQFRREKRGSDGSHGTLLCTVCVTAVSELPVSQYRNTREKCDYRPKYVRLCYDRWQYSSFQLVSIRTTNTLASGKLLAVYVVSVLLICYTKDNLSTLFASVSPTLKNLV